MPKIKVRFIIVWSGFGVYIVVFGMLSGALVFDLIDKLLLPG